MKHSCADRNNGQARAKTTRHNGQVRAKTNWSGRNQLCCGHRETHRREAAVSCSLDYIERVCLYYELKIRKMKDSCSDRDNGKARAKTERCGGFLFGVPSTPSIWCVLPQCMHTSARAVSTSTWSCFGSPNALFLWVDSWLRAESALGAKPHQAHHLWPTGSALYSQIKLTKRDQNAQNVTDLLNKSLREKVRLGKWTT